MSEPAEPTIALQLTSGHAKGHVSVAWARIESAWAAITAGADGKLVARHLRHGQEIKAVECPDQQSLHCLALSPNGSMAAAGDDKGYVRTWSLPELSPGRAAVARFAQRCCCCCWSRDGSQLVAAGDDGAVKIITIKDSKVVRVLRHEAGVVRGLAVDPEGVYLAAAGSDGTLLLWQAADGHQELKRRLGGKVDHADPSCGQALAWHPDGGQLLAVAGPDHDVLLLERLSWSPTAELTGGHGSNVGVAAFSPNGLYIATGDASGKVVVWLVDKALQVSCRQLPCGVSSLSWHPQNNALLVGADSGQYGVWVGPVPQQQQQGGGEAAAAAAAGSQLPSPWQPIDEVDKEADQQAAAAGASKGEELEDELDDDEDAPAVIQRRGLKQRGAAAAAEPAATGVDVLSSLDELMDLDQLEEEAEHAAAAAGRNSGAAAAAGRGYGAARQPPPAHPQPPIHPGSSPAVAGAAGRFLCYNQLGCVVSKAVDDHHVIEVSFHDTSRHRLRVPSLTDYYGFTAASLGHKGVAYISTAAGQEQPSMLVYRCFESWAPGSDWTAALPQGEDAMVVAAGSSAVAVASSARLLRLYSPAGRQLAVISLPGQPVAAAAADPVHVGSSSGGGGPLAAAAAHLLAVVWAEGPPAAHCNTQQLAYAVYDVSRSSQVCSGRLVLSSGSRLSWLGFSSQGLLATMDSGGVLRVRNPEWGGAWLPLLDPAAAKASTGGDGLLWPAWLEGGALLAVATTHKQPHPQVTPRPLLVSVPLSPPGAPAESTPPGQEEGLLTLGLASAALRAAADAAEDPVDAAGLSTDAEAASVECDKAALRLFNSLLKAGRQARALELVGGLASTKSIQGALKLSNHHHLPSLAERISAFLEERVDWEQQQQPQQQQQQQQHAGWGAPDLAMQQDQHSPAELPENDENEDIHADTEQQQQRQQQPVKPVGSIFGSRQAGTTAAAAAAAGGSGGVKRKPAVPDVALGGRAAAGAAAGVSGNPFARKKVTK